MAFGGNEAPNGPHYNLNIIGVPKTKTALMKTMALLASTAMPSSSTWTALRESGYQGEDFQVLDKNGRTAMVPGSSCPLLTPA